MLPRAWPCCWGRQPEDWHRPAACAHGRRPSAERVQQVQRAAHELGCAAPYGEAVAAMRAAALLLVGDLEGATAAAERNQCDGDGDGEWRWWVHALVAYHSGQVNVALERLREGAAGDGAPSAAHAWPEPLTMPTREELLGQIERLQRLHQLSASAEGHVHGHSDGQAMTQYTAALKLGGPPGLVARLHCGRAAAHMRQGQRSDALLDYVCAMAAYPGHVEAYQRWAMPEWACAGDVAGVSLTAAAPVACLVCLLSCYIWVACQLPCVHCASAPLACLARASKSTFPDPTGWRACCPRSGASALALTCCSSCWRRQRPGSMQRPEHTLRLSEMLPGAEPQCRTMRSCWDWKGGQHGRSNCAGECLRCPPTSSTHFKLRVAVRKRACHSLLAGIRKAVVSWFVACAAVWSLKHGSVGRSCRHCTNTAPCRVMKELRLRCHPDKIKRAFGTLVLELAPGDPVWEGSEAEVQQRLQKQAHFAFVMFEEVRANQA